MTDRPTWIEYFLMIAKVVSLRSHDEETKHGCVITKDNKILATGYNGFPKGMIDSQLPNKRPSKYKWMKHSEQNSVWNLTNRYDNMTAYVTGEPCNDCLDALYQVGVTTVYYLDSHGSHLITDEDRDRRRIFIEHTKMVVQPIGYLNLDWINYESWLNNRST